MKKIFYLLCIIFIPLSISAQNRTITGTVSDEKNNEPLVGASIIVVGNATKGTITDNDGKFQLDIPDDKNLTLRFSFVGYQAQDVSINNASVYDIKMAAEKLLDEVVVIGYEAINKRDVLGSVSSVNAKQLKDIPLSNAAEALQGRLAGVEILSTDGAPGTDMIIKIRGGASITQDISPLYIVDGIQVENALSTISPQDIASIDVLKDASTTAIYGARGANGVVIITTKSGREGKSVVSFNTTMGIRKLPAFLDVMQPYDFATWQWERSRGSSTDIASFANTYGTTFDTLSVYKDLPYTNWQQKVFGREARFQNHNLSVSGGTKSTTFNLSLTANREEGIQLESGLDRYLVNFKLEHKVSDKLKVGFTTRYNDQTVSGAGTIDGGTRESSRLRHAIIYRPLILDKPNYGDEEYDITYNQTSRITNPILVTRSEYKKVYTKATYFTGYFNLNLTKNLVLRSTVGMDNGNITTDRFWDAISATASRYANLPVANIGYQRNSSLSNSNTLQYSLKNLKKHHDISLLAGQETIESRLKQTAFETRYFPEDIAAEKALGNMGLGSVPTGSTASQPLPSSYIGAPQRIFSLFGRASYAFDGKYLINANIRSDRSSKFSPENSLLVSPSGSIAWRLSAEPFMKNLTFVNDAKLRYGYGQVGNNRIGNNLYLQLYDVTAAYAPNHAVLPGFVPSALANPDLQWERNVTQNLGLDLSLFKNRVQLTVDAYKNEANNLLLAVKIPSTTGYTEQIQNVGSLSNRGLEFQLNTIPVATRSFNWNSNFNISFNKNRVENLGGTDNIAKASGWQVGGETDYIVKVGQPVGQMFGYITDGFYKIEDFDYNATTQVYTLKAGVPNNSVVYGTAPQPGLIKFKDLNGDGIVDPDNDKTIIGHANPKFTGGWNNQFTMGGFDLSVFVNFVYGNNIYNANKIEFTQADFPNINMLSIMNDRWKNMDEKGVIVKDPVQLAAINANAKLWSPIRAQRWPLHTWAVEDGSYFRINNVTFGYTIPRKVLSKIKVQTFRFFATVNNLATITNYTGYDPDVTTRRSDPLTPGVDFAGYPRSRTWVGGLNITF